MSINLKAKETLIQVGELKGKYRYVLGTELYNKLSESKVIKEAALRSGVSRGVMQACWDAAGEVIKAWTTGGHSVAIPGLGTMRFGVRAKSVETVNEVASGLITARRVIFTPNVEIKQELMDTAIQIPATTATARLSRTLPLAIKAMWKTQTTPLVEVKTTTQAEAKTTTLAEVKTTTQVAIWFVIAP